MLVIRWIRTGSRAFDYAGIERCASFFCNLPLKLAGCVFLSLLTLDAIAQQTAAPDKITTVTGQVIDAVTGNPLEYVTVKFNGSSYATRTDALGKFSLSRRGVFANVTFSHVGFEPVTKVIKPAEVNEMLVRMRGNQTQLNGVVIKSGKKLRYHNKDNPAVALIQQVIDHKKENRMESAAYLQYRQYERMGLSFFNLPQKFLNGKFFSKYKFLLDTTIDDYGRKLTLLPVQLSEKLSDVYYRKQPEKNIQLVNAEKGFNIARFIDTAGVNMYLNQFYGNNLDIYQNNIFLISTQFLSPIADHSPNYYKFFITDTISTPTGKQVELAFTPRTKGNVLFEGKLVVTLDGRYTVTAAEMSVNIRINVSFLRGLKVRLDFARQPNGRYYLSRSDVKGDFGLSKTKGWGVIGQRTVSYSNYKIDTPQPNAFYNGKPLQVLRHADNADTAFWATHRTDTLSKQQTLAYSNINKLEQMPSYKRTMWLLNTLTGSYSDAGWIQIGPIDRFFSFNSQEGLRFEGGGRTTPKFDSTFYLAGYGAIGTRDKKVKVDAIAYLSLNKTAPYHFPNNYFSVSYLYDVDVPGHTFSITNKQSAFSSFQSGKTNYWLYSSIFQLQYVKDFENHFSYNVTFKNWDQSPAAALVYQLNDDESTLVHNLVTTELDLHLRYAPHEQIIQGTRERHSIHNQYPIFDVQLNRGFKGFVNGSYKFTDIGVNIYKRFYLSQLGYTDVTVIGGYVQGKVPFPLLNISPANQTIAYNRDAYNDMNYLEFVSDHYAGINLTHTFNGFLLNKIPLIQRLKWREFLTAKILYGGLRDENNPALTAGLYRLPPATNSAYGTYALSNTPYIEAGAGIGNIFKFLRVDVIRRFNYLNHPGASEYGVKFSFQPEF